MEESERAKEIREKGLYGEGDRVLVADGDEQHEGKVIFGEKENGKWKYKVHYQGWNKKWDEWLSGSRLVIDRRYHKEHRSLYHKAISKDPKKDKGKSLQADNKGSAVKPGKEKSQSWTRDREEGSGKAGERDKTKDQDGDRGLKRKAEEDAEGEGRGGRGEKHPNTMRLWMPSGLKQFLVEDCEAVSREGKLVPLPRAPCVSQLLSDYLEAVMEEAAAAQQEGGPTEEGPGSAKAKGVEGAAEERVDMLAEVLSGLQAYFNAALPGLLLYKGEREQCAEAVEAEGEEEVAPCDLYGAEHFLRLFVKLPDLLPYDNLAQESLKALEKRFINLLKYLDANQGELFLSTADYQGGRK